MLYSFVLLVVVSSLLFPAESECAAQHPGHGGFPRGPGNRVGITPPPPPPPPNCHRCPFCPGCPKGGPNVFSSG
jgi:hypothetical protein